MSAVHISFFFIYSLDLLQPVHHRYTPSQTQIALIHKTVDGQPYKNNLSS